jgi:uncharacterized protein (TIGR00369 family)
MSDVIPDLSPVFMAAIDRGEHLLQMLQMRDVDEDSGPDRLTIDLDNEPRLMNHRGALHGAVVATLVDVAAGRLATRVVAEGNFVVTADMNIRYLSPVMVGPARTTARIVRAGRRSIVTTVEITDLHNGRLACLASASFSVLQPRSPDAATLVSGI